MHESCHIWICHVTHINASCHISESHHIWMSHVTYEWVRSHQWVMFTCEWGRSHMSTMHVTSTSHATYEWVRVHISISHITRLYHSHLTNASLFFLLLLLWIAIILALFLRTPCVPWMPDFRSQAPSSPSKLVAHPHRWHFLAHPLLLVSFSWWSWACPFESCPRPKKQDRHWVDDMDTEADSKRMRRLGRCQQNEGEYRSLTVSAQNIVFFMFWRNFYNPYKIWN